MKLLRNRRVRKAISVLLLLVFVQSLIPSYYLYALTTGPHQPEYTSYEPPGATDMVNLLTGDFTTSLPILDVPGPEGSFQVPLTYHAGIGPDQEASWVGLGWTINVGSITRNIFAYPDDACGEVNGITVRDFGFSGIELNTYIIGKVGFNNVQGAYGSLNFLNLVNISYADGEGTLGIAGINVSDDGNVSFNAVQFIAAAGTVLSLGAAASASSAITVPQEVAKQVATNVAMNVGLEAGSFLSAPSASSNGYWQYQKNERRIWPFIKIQRTWLDLTRLEEMYGTIYCHRPQLIEAEFLTEPNHTQMSLEINNNPHTLKQFPRSANNKGAASDIYFNSQANYVDATSPAILATDKYSVKAPGISGSIKPYRLETGSVSVQRDMTRFHNRLAPVPFESYKVPFVYEGSISNAYFHHAGGSGTVTSPTLHYGLSNVLGNSDPAINTTMKFDFDDVSLSTQRIKPEVLSTNHKISQANHIEWLTNDEISNTAGGFSNGFLDYFAGTQRSDFRDVQSFGSVKVFYSSSEDFTDGVIRLSTSSDLDYFVEQGSVTVNVTAYDTEEEFQASGVGGTIYTESVTVTDKNETETEKEITVNLSSSLISNITGKYCNIYVITTNKPKAPGSIGGFSITSVNGLTYHFALPVYDYDNYTRAEHPTQSANHSIIERKEPFANTWLLSGITGADFIDRGGIDNAGNGIIDEGDWGHWIKFNYGKHTDDYRFRSPWLNFNLDASETVKSYTEGGKQLYYLNSIETRSHVALFLKGVRADNMGKNDATSLRLEEIVLLSREHYKKLGAPTASNGFNMQLCSGNISKMWMLSDFYATSGTQPVQGQFVIRNASKRIRFTYDYTLAAGVPNSNAGGKLTLKRISILGRSDQKIVPDYKFEYANNYPYNSDHWDGWGMYSPISAQTSRPVSQIDEHGTAWSLSKITTPLGSEILVNLERDTYSSISGRTTWDPNASIYEYTSPSANANNDLLANRVYVTSTTGLNAGDKVLVTGSIQYRCSQLDDAEFLGYQTEQIINSISGNYVEFSNDSYINIGCLSNDIIVEFNQGTVARKLSKKGGDIRVHSLIMKNEYGKENKIRYLYDDGAGYSSGVVSQEPEYIKTHDYPFYDFPGYPFTPVMYGRVTTLNGKLSNDADYHTRQVYEFETPHEDMYKFISNVYSYKEVIFSRNVERAFDVDDHYRDYLTEVKHTLDDWTAKIGSLKSIKTYDRTSLKSTSQMNYTSEVTNADEVQRYQGVYSEGTLLFDQIIEVQPDPDAIHDLRYYKTNRTSILSHPHVLKEVINTKDGFTVKTTNDSWDFVSGQVVEKTNTSALGVKTQSLIVPAYTVYPEMGSKAVNANNKNMLLQEAASYAYKLDQAGNRLGLIGATAQTWRNDWNNYRSFDEVGQSFVDVDDEPTGVGVWRKAKSYQWKGDYSRLLQASGKQEGIQSFSVTDEFDFSSSAPNPGWQYSWEVLRFDHYGMPLESNDMNNIHAATKMGYDNRRVIAEATNAEYNEIAFSSAEDEIAGTGYFGGEVAKKDGAGDAIVVEKSLSIETHTGNCALSLSTGVGFVYKPQGLKPNKTYRAAVWTNSSNGRLYYKLDGAPEVLSQAPIEEKKAGNWYRIDLSIPIGPTFTSLEVGVKSVSGTVVFDDFRFQPVDAVMTCYVSEPLDFEFSILPPAYSPAYSYVLNNDNMYTMYESNERGKIVKHYQESFKYDIQLISESRDNYRRFHTNQ